MIEEAKKNKAKKVDWNKSLESPECSKVFGVYSVGNI